MNWVGCLACLLAGFDDLQRGLGLAPQNIFAPGAEWFWLITSAVWFVWSIAFLVNGIKGDALDEH
jgi:hypothetical protein